MNLTTKKITIAGVVGAIYVALTLLLSPISFGPVQFRVAEGFCILPLLFPECYLGLTIGCLMANIFGGYGIIDIVIGTFATLLSTFFVRLIGKTKIHHLIKLVISYIIITVINGLLVPIVFVVCGTEIGYFAGVLSVALGEIVSLVTFGTFTYFCAFDLIRRKILK